MAPLLNSVKKVTKELHKGRPVQHLCGACVRVRACTSARMSGGGLVLRGGNVFKRVTVTLKLDRSCSVQYSGKIPFNIYIGGPEVKTSACSQQHQCVCVNGVFH